VKMSRPGDRVRRRGRRLLREGGPLAGFFFANCWVYRRAKHT
jgi:hypothetical protein